MVCSVLDDKVSCLYMAPFKTSDPDNHQHLFIGMNSGSIHIFDLEDLEFSNYTIQNMKNLNVRENKVTDIKCQPEKMHRVLYTQ